MTEEIVKKFQLHYSNLVYYKQHRNVGFDRNLKTILDLAKGEYIKPHGDDDLFTNGSIYSIINRINENPDASLFFVHCGQSLPVIRGTGYDNYIRSLIGSNGISFLTALIVSNKSYKEISNKEKYLDSKIYQVYIQMEILKNNPNYCLLGGSIVSSLSGRAGRRDYNLGEVFIGSYFDIIQGYKQHGLSEQIIKEQKYYVLNSIIIPVAIENVTHNNQLTTSGLDEIFTKYYSVEEYFIPKLNELRRFMRK